MRMRLGLLLGALLAALLLVACDAGASQQAGVTPIQNAPATGGGTPGAQRTPRAGGTRPANATPGAQGTARPAATPTVRSATTLVAPTAVIVSVITGTIGTAPTAVPIPAVTLPTLVPQAVITNGASSTSEVPFTPEPLPSVPPLPSSVPVQTLADLRGKIIFFSDRGGGYAQLYSMNPDGSNQQLCNCSDLLTTLVNNEVTSPDKNQFLFIKTVGGGGVRRADLQIWAHNNTTGFEAVVTGAAPGFPGVDYDPVWSPDSRHIAWVTEANGFDEIYVFDSVSGENTRLTQSSGEWYKHPSFSPNGSQIVFWTNRENSLLKQVWVMNLDGSNMHNISGNSSNDWDPIWVK